MRRPVRDERWTDPEGGRWQVLQVNTWRTETRMPTEDEVAAGKKKPGRPITIGPAKVESIVMVNAEGAERKVTPTEIKDWNPDLDSNGEQLGDPLAGQRKWINEEVRSGSGLLRFKDECPVSPGERYHLPCGEVFVTKVAEKTNKRGDKHFEVSVTRIESDKVYFLRNTVPAAKPGEYEGPTTDADIEKARIDGNYLTGAPDNGGDKLPTVPHDWEDKGAAAREIERQGAVRERMTEEQVLREATNLAARVKQEVIERGSKGRDLTHLLADVYERLAASDEQQAA